jgi:cation diffusion facilitator family transporter
VPPPPPIVRARRLAILSVVVNAGLSALNLSAGLVADSTSTVALGVEFAGDVLASSVVLAGLAMAARPPDANHPYGHGRLETVAGLLVGFTLVAGGIGIAYRSLAVAGASHSPPGALAVWGLLVTIAVRVATAALKFRIGGHVRSTSLVADAWNDAVDLVSAVVALAAVALSRWHPDRFLLADHAGGVVVGLVVVLTGAQIVRQATLELADTMPSPAFTAELGAAVMSVPGVLGVEKQLARKTGLQYHVDLHIEVDPALTVRASHAIAHDVKRRVLADVPWVADVLVHIEPAPDGSTSPGVRPQGT